MKLKKEIESLLFSSGKTMTEEELSELTGNSKAEVKEALTSLKAEYDSRDTSLMLVQSSESWKLNVREKYMNLVTKIVADTELPFPVLETLAVIAYKAPVLQAEVIKVRGSNAYEHIGLLVNEDFVEKKKEGRSFRLNLTAKFFKYFDVEGEKDIKDALKDIKIPEEIPNKVGEMDVVDVPPGEVGEAEKIKEKLGDLEVVDEPEEPEDDEEKINIDNNKPDPDFIADIDKRIEEVSKRNDEVDQDELFKRQEEVTKEMQEEADEAEGSVDATESEKDSKLAEEQDDKPADTPDDDSEKIIEEQKEVVESAAEKLAEITKELEQEKKEIEEIGKEASEDKEPKDEPEDEPANDSDEEPEEDDSSEDDEEKKSD